VKYRNNLEGVNDEGNGKDRGGGNCPVYESCKGIFMKSVDFTSNQFIHVQDTFNIHLKYPATMMFIVG